MDLYLDGSYINAKEVYSAFFNYRPETKTTVTGRLWWKKIKTEEVPNWTIAMNYVSGNGQHGTFTCSSGDKNHMEGMFRSLMEQLKANGSQWADRALEQAILNSGSTK